MKKERKKIFKTEGANMIWNKHIFQDFHLKISYLLITSFVNFYPRDFFGSYNNL
jgi:hypothetical protein